MSEEEMTRIEGVVSNAVREGVEHVATRHAEAVREVGIRLSPLEKWLKQEVVVTLGDQEWDGTLMDFCMADWVELERYGQRLVVYTGAGTTVRLKR